MTSLRRKHTSSRGRAGNHWRSKDHESVERDANALRKALAASRKLGPAMRNLARKTSGEAHALRRWAGPTEATRRGGRTRAGRRDAGRDRRFRLRVPTVVLLWLAFSWVASNLTLVALRSDLTRVRYDLSQASTLLGQLDEDNRVLTLALRKLHDPRRLREIALARGFGPPERIVELP